MKEGGGKRRRVCWHFPSSSSSRKNKINLLQGAVMLQILVKTSVRA
jgi:hypothetical protein